MIEGYEVRNVIRKNRKSGGVAISIPYFSSVCLSVCMSVCLSVCLYVCLSVCLSVCRCAQTAGRIAAYSDQIQLLMQKVKHNKTVFLCGDMKVDLLKYGSDTNTHYVDTMFSIGLYPLIDKPTRITTYSATLIYTIFNNELYSTISSGLLINDISDHLPIFAICKYKDVQMTQSSGLLGKQAIPIAALKNDLSSYQTGTM